MGRREGGLFTARINKRKYGEDFYKRIGAMGGRASSTGRGLDHPATCDCSLIQGIHNVMQCRGKLGGLKSRRTGIKNGEGKSHSKK